jgi:hypothetical protein
MKAIVVIRWCFQTWLINSGSQPPPSASRTPHQCTTLTVKMHLVQIPQRLPTPNNFLIPSGLCPNSFPQTIRDNFPAVRRNAVVDHSHRTHKYAIKANGSLKQIIQIHLSLHQIPPLNISPPPPLATPTPPSVLSISPSPHPPCAPWPNLDCISPTESHTFSGLSHNAGTVERVAAVTWSLSSSPWGKKRRTAMKTRDFP